MAVWYFAPLFFSSSSRLNGAAISYFAMIPSGQENPAISV